MIWLIVVSLFFVILGSCQSQHEGSKNNILDPYISKPPALGEETGGENRGIVSDMITGGIKEILRPKGPGGRYYPSGGGAMYQYGETETEQQDYPDYSAINNMESDGNRGLGGIIGRLVKPIGRILRPGIRPGGRFPPIRPSIGIGGGGPSYNYGYEYDTYGNYQEESEFPTTKFTESPYIGLSLQTSTVEPRFDEGFGNPLRFPTTKFTESPYIGLSLRTSTVEPRFDEGFG